ncbi:MAG TPA: STAS/SEC14 domain-containing protein [Sphingopyxis sp.]|nr:STAS/SEC14 domain-containing protein [Sphingopyxis sp.]HMP45338.1 STAS/SEC14 domain-containing protein [Sphingopyxis sp.]HMQ20242.1 STAS/SEC14 domain-containing protein [Sphingopyxis sp.]
MVAPFVIETDETGVISVVASGFWSADDLEGHFVDLKTAVEAARARFGVVRVLVDLRASRVQSQEVFDRLREATSATYGERDRIAIVAESTLLTMQMRRLDAKAGRAAFADVRTARDWLLSA